MNSLWANQRSYCKPLKSKKDEEEAHIKRQCTGKVQHKTFEIAEQEALRMTAKMRNEIVFRAYSCMYCGWNHIGRKPEYD